MANWIYRTGLGQDHHRYLQAQAEPARAGLQLGGVQIDCALSFAANSDGDVILHALTNALSSLSGEPFLGPPADALCQQGITDSRVYLQAAYQTLMSQRPGGEITQVALAVEGRQPRLYEHLQPIRHSVAQLLNLAVESVGITATTGEGLTGMGRGEGLGVLALVTFREPEKSDEGHPQTL